MIEYLGAQNHLESIGFSFQRNNDLKQSPPWLGSRRLLSGDHSHMTGNGEREFMKLIEAIHSGFKVKSRPNEKKSTFGNVGRKAVVTKNCYPHVAHRVDSRAAQRAAARGSWTEVAPLHRSVPQHWKLVV